MCLIGFMIFSWLVLICSHFSLLPSGELTFCNGKSPFLMGKSTISMAIFNCFLYVHQRVTPINIPLNPIKPPFSYGFPMVFLWFSYGFPMVFLWFWGLVRPLLLGERPLL